MLPHLSSQGVVKLKIPLVGCYSFLEMSSGIHHQVVLVGFWMESGYSQLAGWWLNSISLSFFYLGACFVSEYFFV